MKDLVRCIENLWWDRCFFIVFFLIFCFLYFFTLIEKGPNVIRGGRSDPRGLSQVRGPVTPFFDDRFLHHTWVCLAIDTNFLGNFDTIRLGYKSAMEKTKTSYRYFLTGIHTTFMNKIILSSLAIANIVYNNSGHILGPSM